MKRLGYVESTLAPGEQIRYQARYHWWHYRVALLLLVIAALVGGASALYVGRPPNGGNAAAIGRFALIFAAIAGFVFVLRYVQASAVEMVVTSARAIRKRGIFRREVAQTALRQVRDVSLRRGLAGRFLGFGTVSFETGTETRPLRFPDVCDPEAVRSAAVAPEETSAAESRSSS